MAKAELTKPEKQERERDDLLILPPLDYSYLNVTQVEGVLQLDHRPLPITYKHGEKAFWDDNKKCRGKIFKINNNAITQVIGLTKTLETLFSSVQSVVWIDLSFNKIKQIDADIVALSQLEILYLHGNAISDLKEVDKLVTLSKLKKLTLYANPVDAQKGYRVYVLGKLPQINALDFAAVSKAERKQSELWKTMVFGDKQKKKQNDDSES